MSEPQFSQPELIQEPRAVTWLGVTGVLCGVIPCGVMADGTLDWQLYRIQLADGKVPLSKAIPKNKMNFRGVVGRRAARRERTYRRINNAGPWRPETVG